MREVLGHEHDLPQQQSDRDTTREANYADEHA
jgi:hypothetical protein